MPERTGGVLVLLALAWAHRRLGRAQRLCRCSDREGGSVQPASVPRRRPALLLSLTPRHEDRSQRGLKLIHRVCFVPEDLPNLFQMLSDSQRAFAKSHRCAFGRVWLKQSVGFVVGAESYIAVHKIMTCQQSCHQVALVVLRGSLPAGKGESLLSVSHAASLDCTGADLPDKNTRSFFSISQGYLHTEIPCRLNFTLVNLW